MPPNPYHVVSKAIPVSAQDSEIQSVVSSDLQYDYDTKSLGSNMYLNGVGTGGGQGHKSRVSNLPKLDKHIKRNLIANQNAQVYMPEFHLVQPEASMTIMQQQAGGCVIGGPLVDGEVHHGEPSKGKPGVSKKTPIPLSESDPHKFFELLSSKLEQVVDSSDEGRGVGVNNKRAVSNSQLPVANQGNYNSLNHSKHLIQLVIYLLKKIFKMPVKK
jgi:hypothetical protein